MAERPTTDDALRELYTILGGSIDDEAGAHNSACDSARDCERVAAILSTGEVDVNGRFEYGRSVLSLALEYDLDGAPPAMLQTVLSAGCDPNAELNAMEHTHPLTTESDDAITVADYDAETVRWAAHYDSLAQKRELLVVHGAKLPPLFPATTRRASLIHLFGPMEWESGPYGEKSERKQTKATLRAFQRSGLALDVGCPVRVVRAPPERHIV
eukprot:1889065-Prymnesium_polylepis.1